MIFRLAIFLLAAIGFTTPALAFCIFGWGSSCLPDERLALRYVNERLKNVEHPFFPVVTSIYLDRMTFNPRDQNRDRSKAGIDQKLMNAQQMAEAINRGESCTTIMRDRRHTLGTPHPQTLIRNCEIMQTLMKKSLISQAKANYIITESRFSVLQYYDFYIVATEQPSLVEIQHPVTQGTIGKIGDHGIAISAFGEASAVNKYSREFMGMAIGVVEFTVPIIENEFAVECRRLNLAQCAQAGKRVVGAIEFLKRSDGWGDHRVHFSRQ